MIWSPSLSKEYGINLNKNFCHLNLYKCLLNTCCIYSLCLLVLGWARWRQILKDNSALSL